MDIKKDSRGKYTVSIGNGKPIKTHDLIEVLECVCHYFDHDNHVKKNNCPFCRDNP